jgi:hypothetical protein
VQPQEDGSCQRKSGSEGSKRGLALKAATAAVAVLLALVMSAYGGTTSSQSSSSVTQSHMLLTMSVINEGCPNRQAIWEGVWSLESPTTPPA